MNDATKATLPERLQHIIGLLEVTRDMTSDKTLKRSAQRMLDAAECEYPDDPKQPNPPAVAPVREVVVLLDGGVVAHEESPDDVRLSVVHVDLLTEGDDAEAKGHWEGASEAAREAVRELFPRASGRFE
jgi:hypothetical protein